MAVPSFVINLRSQPERMALVQATLDALAMPFERVDGIDAAHCDAEVLARFDPVRTGYHFSAGEIGCFLSHEAIWQRIVREGIPNALVLEDDVRIARDLPTFLSTPGILPASLHLLKLETLNFRADIDRKPAASACGIEVRRLRSKHLGSAAYVVSREGARLLLEGAKVPFGPVDHHLFDPYIRCNGHLVRYQAVPAPIIQYANGPLQDMPGLPAFASGIEGVTQGRHSRRLPFSAKLWREIKRPFLQFSLYSRRSLARRFHGAEAMIVPFAGRGVLDDDLERIAQGVASPLLDLIQR